MNEPLARRTVIQLAIAQVAEIRLDVGGANQGKLRLGLVLTIATVVVTASGWPPFDAVQKALYLVLVALPSTGIGVGLVVDELMQARADRLGSRLADDREVEALRARIVADAARRSPSVTGEGMTKVAAPAGAVKEHGPPPRSTRPSTARGGRLIGGRHAAAPFRTGFLGLR